MAKQSGLGDNFYVGGYDLSADANSIDQITTPWDVFDTTGVNEFAHERQLTLRTGDMQFTTFMDPTVTPTTPGVPGTGTPLISTYNQYILVTITGGTMSNVSINGQTVGTGAGTYLLPPLGSITLTYTVAPTWSWAKLGAEHDALSGLPRADTIGTYFRGQAVGNPAASMNAKQINYDWTRDNTGGITGKVELQASQFGLEWGNQLTPGIRTDTTATSGPNVNDGAATNFGAQAYLQVFAFVGTSVTVAVQDSADGTTFANVSGLVFSAVSAAPAFQRLAISNTSTLRQYVRVATTGTFSYARFAVMYNRNLTAGVAF